MLRVMYQNCTSNAYMRRDDDNDDGADDHDGATNIDNDEMVRMARANNIEAALIETTLLCFSVLKMESRYVGMELHRSPYCVCSLAIWIMHKYKVNIIFIVMNIQNC